MDRGGHAAYSQVVLLTLNQLTTDLQLHASLSANGLMVRINGRTTANGTIRLYDMNGKIIVSGTITAGNQQVIIYTRKENIASGIYIAKARFDDEQLTTKVIQQ